MVMGYFRDYIIAVIEDKNVTAIENGHLDTFFSEEDIGRYDDRADFLSSHFDFKKMENVEFGSLLMEYSLSSWGKIQEFERVLDIDTYYENQIYDNAELLLKYEEFVGIPENIMEMLESYAILSDFRNKYKDLPSSPSGYDTDMIEDIVNNQKYDVMNKAQVEALANLVYYNFSDDNHTFSQSSYPYTRIMNQIAINADFDEDVIKAMEKPGWYSDEESIEQQLSKVDMADTIIHMKKVEREEKNENLLTPSRVAELRDEYRGVLEIDYREGAMGLEDQVNDYILVKFDGKVIYEDEGRGNSFGDIRLNGKRLFQLLQDNDYKAAADIFMF